MRSPLCSGNAEPEPLRQALEFHLLRGSLASIDRLSFDGACRLAKGIARLWWVLDVPRRRVAAENILRSGIESDRRRASRLSRRSAEHFAVVVVESLKSAEILEGDRWQDRLAVDIPADVGDVLEDPEQALIMVSGHLGNWEIAAQWLSRYKPVAGITRPMNNPRIEALIQSRKPRYRFHPIPKYGADATRLISVLKNHEILALLVDQHARAGGVEIDFFGHPAQTYPTPAMLHLVTGTPLCFASCRRVGRARFELSTSPLIRREPTGDRRADVSALLTAINGRLEDEIRRAPDQYLWGHRRWRDDPGKG